MYAAFAALCGFVICNQTLAAAASQYSIPDLPGSVRKNRQTAFDCGAPIRTPAVLRSASDVERPKLDHVKVQEEEQIYHNRQPTSQERDLQHPYNVYNCLSNAARSKPEEPSAAE